MAGEVLQKIRKKETEAQDIINRSKEEAQTALEHAAEGKKKLIDEKDALLKKEEVRISQRYEEEASKVLKEIAHEEEEQIERIDSMCGKNLLKVVEYITEEIVKE